MKSIHDIYARDETFLDFVAHDLDDGAVWFDNSEFARFHDVNGKKILSVLTSDIRSRNVNIKVGNNQNFEGITKGQSVLFVRVHDMKRVPTGSKFKLDGRLYIVGEVSLIQEQIWRITLEANNA